MAKSSLYLNEELLKKLRIDGDRSVGMSTAVNRAVDRLDMIIASEEKTLLELFTNDEWNAMRNTTNGTIWEPAAVIRGGMMAEIQDRLDDELVSFGAYRDELEPKLATLTVSQQVALIDMIERWWAK